MSAADEAIWELDHLSGDDPEHAHAMADDIIEELLPEDVRNALHRLRRRTRWWACS